MQFGEEGRFSAVDPEAPSSLLTINPSAYFFNQSSTGQIINRSTRSDLVDGTALGLRVPNNESLTLLGGDVSIEGGGMLSGLTALGGRIEIGAAGGPGIVELTTDRTLRFLDTVPRANISLKDGALVNTILENGGAINFFARELDILNSSIIATGIAFNTEGRDSQSGDIYLDVVGLIRLERSAIGNIIGQNGIGRGGDIKISSESLTISSDSQLTTENFGIGNGGNIYISSSGEVSVNNGSILSRLNEQGTGDAGSILIRSGSFRADDGARINARGNRNGNAGSIGIYANSIFLGNGTSIDK